MSQSDISPEVLNEANALSEQEVIYRLAAFGINSCNQSYDQRQKAISDRFTRIDLGVIANMWDNLDERVKIRILNSNAEKFKAWISSYTQNGEVKDV